MANARSYRVLVDGETVYKGPIRTAELVYKAVSQTIVLTKGDPNIPVTLAIEMKGDFLYV